MSARPLLLIATAALLGACNGNDCRSEADLDGFARFSTYAAQINACYLQNDCTPLCRQLFQLTPDENLVECDIGKPRADGIRVRARVEFHDVCAPDWGYTVGDDDDWDDGTDDGSYGGGYDDGGYSQGGGGGGYAPAPARAPAAAPRAPAPAPPPPAPRRRSAQAPAASRHRAAGPRG